MTRKTWMVTWMVVLTGVFLAGAAECRGADDPIKVKKAFEAALKTGGAKAARLYITKASQAALDEGTLTLNANTGNFLYGEAKIQGNKATVLTWDAKSPDEKTTVFLVMEGGKWKIDMIRVIQEIPGGVDIEKEMKKMQEKLRDGMTAAMLAAMTEAMGGPKPEGKTFLLVDMGWGDPFINPRDRTKGAITPDEVITGLGDEKQKIWEDALSALTVKVIIGFEDDLAAVVAGVRVHPGDTIKGGKLRFEVKKITSNAVYLRCTSEEEEFKKFSGITVRRKIPL